MSESEIELCLCPSRKSRSFVSENGNVCPACNKALIDRELYEIPLPKLEEVAPVVLPEEDSDEAKIPGRGLGEILEMLGNASFGSVKDRKGTAQNIRLKPPTFNGTGDPKHFWLKMANYYEACKITKESEKICILKQCLEGTALDLFLSLNTETQSDIEILGKKFQQHFRPLGHDIVETQTFLKMQKMDGQSVSDFHMQVRKKASELLLPDSLIRVTLLQGLPVAYQKYIAYKEAISLDEILDCALEYEKIAKLDSPRKMQAATVAPPVTNVSEDLARFSEQMNSTVGGLAEQMKQLMEVVDTRSKGLNPAAQEFMETTTNNNRNDNNNRYGSAHNGRNNNLNSNQDQLNNNNYNTRNSNVGSSRSYRRDNANYVGGNRQLRGRCYGCNQIGHFIRDCPVSSNSNNPDWRRSLQNADDPQSTDQMGPVRAQGNFSGPISSEPVKQGVSKGIASREVLQPVDRLNNQEWHKGHSDHQLLLSKGGKCVLLGDSITRHLSKSRVTKRPEWQKMDILNLGLSGDRVENLLYRIQKSTFGPTIEKVVLAIGTNNLFVNSAREIIGTIQACYEALEEKIPSAKIFVQSILPRAFVRKEIAGKIVEINEELGNLFQDCFVNLHTPCLRDDGEINRAYFRRDGLHLSDKGNSWLAKTILKILSGGEKSSVPVSTCNSGDQGSLVISYAKSTMMFHGKIGQRPVDVLLDTGSFVTLINKRVLQEGPSSEIEPSFLQEVVGIGNMPQKVLGLVQIELEAQENVLPLACHVIKEMRYDIVLGRDMLDQLLLSIDHVKGLVYFKRERSTDTFVQHQGQSPCLLVADTILEPHSVTAVKVSTGGFPKEEGVIKGDRRLVKQGIIIANSKYQGDGIDSAVCLAHNVSSKRVSLGRNSPVATIETSGPPLASVWMIHAPEEKREPASSAEEHGNRVEPLQDDEKLTTEELHPGMGISCVELLPDQQEEAKNTQILADELLDTGGEDESCVDSSEVASSEDDIREVSVVTPRPGFRQSQVGQSLLTLIIVVMLCSFSFPSRTGRPNIGSENVSRLSNAGELFRTVEGVSEDLMGTSVNSIARVVARIDMSSLFRYVLGILVMRYLVMLQSQPACCKVLPPPRDQNWYRGMLWKLLLRRGNYLEIKEIGNYRKCSLNVRFLAINK